MSVSGAARSAAVHNQRDSVAPADLRRLFWVALRVAHRISRNKRQGFCRRVVVGDFVSIEMRPRARGGDRASFGGVFHCGRNGCPTCGPKIASERAADIGLAIASHCHAGGRVMFSTWTMPHCRADELAALLGGMGQAAGAARRNKIPARLLRELSRGQIAKLETTVGPNGWHPHRHELGFLRAGVTDDQAAELDAARFAAWSSSLERRGFGAASESGHDFRILDVDGARAELALYVAKSAGHELAAAGTKRARGDHRTPLELLLDLAELGDELDRRLWLEWEKAMHGRRVLRWSPGLREQLLGDVVPELTDQELADSTDGAGRVIAAIGHDTWRRVFGFRLTPAVLLSVAELYDVDEERTDAVERYLVRHGLGHLEAGVGSPPGAGSGGGSEGP